jgi:hypothetical protein
LIFLGINKPSGITGQPSAARFFSSKSSALDSDESDLEVVNPEKSTQNNFVSSKKDFRQTNERKAFDHISVLDGIPRLMMTDPNIVKGEPFVKYLA